MKNLSLTVAFICLCLTQPYFLNAQRNNPKELLPDSSHNNQWSRGQDYEYYEGEDLFFLINGGAELYLEYGFSDVVSAIYSNNDDEKIAVDIFRMKDQKAAFGIFSNYRNTGKPFEIGEEGVYSNDFTGFYKCNILVMLRRYTGSNLSEDMKDLASSIEKEIICGDLQKNWLIRDTLTGLNPEITYIRGNIGLHNQYLFGYSNNFQFTDGFVYNYDQSKLYFLKYSDSVSAGKILNSMIQGFKENDKFILEDIDNNALPFNFKDKNGNQFSIYRHRSYIFIIQFKEDIKFNRFIDYLESI